MWLWVKTRQMCSLMGDNQIPTQWHTWYQEREIQGSDLVRGQESFPEEVVTELRSKRRVGIISAR